MSIFSRTATCGAAALLLCIVSAPASAQSTVNRCTDAKGQVVLTDRPCVSEGAAQRGSDGRRPSSMACTRLGDTIRHAPLRGVRPEVVDQLSAEYARACGDADVRADAREARQTAAAPATTR